MLYVKDMDIYICIKERKKGTMIINNIICNDKLSDFFFFIGKIWKKSMPSSLTLKLQLNCFKNRLLNTSANKEI